jgi:hypothetical protein
VHGPQSISRVGIQLGIHNHHVADGKCRESIKETRRLIVEEVDHTLDAKIFSISLNASYLMILVMA